MLENGYLGSTENTSSYLSSVIHHCDFLLETSDIYMIVLGGGT